MWGVGPALGRAPQKNGGELGPQGEGEGGWVGPALGCNKLNVL